MTDDFIAVRWTRDDNGKLAGIRHKLSEYAAGDAEFLDPDPRRWVQIRPLVPSDPGTLHNAPEWRMIVAREPGMVEIRTRVPIPLAWGRTNTPTNVDIIIRVLERLGEEFARSHPEDAKIAAGLRGAFERSGRA